MKNANLRNNEFYSAYGCKECDADYQCIDCDDAERVLFQDGFDSNKSKAIYIHEMMHHHFSKPINTYDINWYERNIIYLNFKDYKKYISLHFPNPSKFLSK